MKTDVESNGEEEGDTRVPRQKNVENLNQIMIQPMKVYVTAQVPATSTIEKRPIRKPNQ